MRLYDVKYTLDTESYVNGRAIRCITEDGVATIEDFAKMIAVYHFGSVEYAASVAITDSEFLATL